MPTSGVGNTYEIGDAYSVFNVIKCTLGGGNPTAVDDLAASIDAAVPSVGTFLTLALSTNASLIGGTSPWDDLLADHEIIGSFGEWVGKKLLTIKKFIGLQ